MTISVGDRLPEATFSEIGENGRPQPVASRDVFDGRKIAVFAVPGAYTPTCHNSHMPSFVRTADKLREKGVDEVCCVSVNDAFVLNEWGKATGARDAGIRMLADPQAEFTKAIGLDFTAPPAGLIDRSRRYSMLVENGEVKVLNVEDNPGQATCSLGEELVDQV